MFVNTSTSQTFQFWDKTLTPPLVRSELDVEFGPRRHAPVYDAAERKSSQLGVECLLLHNTTSLFLYFLLKSLSPQNLLTRRGLGHRNPEKHGGWGSDALVIVGWRRATVRSDGVVRGRRASGWHLHQVADRRCSRRRHASSEGGGVYWSGDRALSWMTYESLSSEARLLCFAAASPDAAPGGAGPGRCELCRRRLLSRGASGPLSLSWVVCRFKEIVRSTNEGGESHIAEI